MASTAESLRSTCGSVRGEPECSKQRSPAATPQVGQGTDDNCSGVRSLIRIRIEYDKIDWKTVRFGTVSGTGPTIRFPRALDNLSGIAHKFHMKPAIHLSATTVLNQAGLWQTWYQAVV